MWVSLRRSIASHISQGWARDSFKERLLISQDLLWSARQENEVWENMQIVLSFLSTACRKHKDELLTRRSRYEAAGLMCRRPSSWKSARRVSEHSNKFQGRSRNVLLFLRQGLGRSGISGTLNDITFIPSYCGTRVFITLITKAKR